MFCFFFFLRTFPVPPWTKVDFFIHIIKSGRFWSDVLFTCADPSFQSHSDQSFEMNFGIMSKFRISPLPSDSTGWLGRPRQTGTDCAWSTVGSGNATEWSRNHPCLQNCGTVPVCSKSPSIPHCQDLSAPVNQLSKCFSSYVSFCNVDVKGHFYSFQTTETISLPRE